jgi:hypothetical protein
MLGGFSRKGAKQKRKGRKGITKFKKALKKKISKSA